MPLFSQHNGKLNRSCSRLVRYINMQRNFSLALMYLSKKKKKIQRELDCGNLIRSEKKACPDMPIPLFRVQWWRHDTRAFRSWDSEIWPLAKFRSSTNSRRRAAPVGSRSLEQQFIHDMPVFVFTGKLTYVPVTIRNERQTELRVAQPFPGNAKWMNQLREELFFYFCASHPEIMRFHNCLESVNRESLSVFTRLFPRHF